MCEIAVVARAIERRGDRFLQGLFTPAERAAAAGLANSSPYFAQVFAAKEACAKALGSGFSNRLRWTDMEILADETGRPRATLTGGARDELLRLQTGAGASVHVSWRQDAAFAMALVVIEA